MWCQGPFFLIEFALSFFGSNAWYQGAKVNLLRRRVQGQFRFQIGILYQSLLCCFSSHKCFFVFIGRGPSLDGPMPQSIPTLHALQQVLGLVAGFHCICFFKWNAGFMSQNRVNAGGLSILSLPLSPLPFSFVTRQLSPFVARVAGLTVQDRFQKVFNSVHPHPCSFSWATFELLPLGQ